MTYPVSEQLLTRNRSGQKLVPEGFVVHATATPGATAQNEHDYFNSGDRQASAHYFVDWTQIVRTVPENEVAWHAGPTAKHKYLSVEMCVPNTHDPAKFQEIWNRTVWLVADAFVRYGWSTGPGLWSHSGISDMNCETDHQDPIAYFKEYGKTFDGFVAEVDAMILKLKGKGGNDVLAHAVVYFTARDFSSAQMVADKLGGCATFCRSGSSTIHAEAKSSKHLVIVGGPECTDHINVTNCCGSGAPETAIKAAQYAQKL